MEDPEKRPLPGEVGESISADVSLYRPDSLGLGGPEVSFDLSIPIRATLEAERIPHLVAPCADINDPALVRILKSREEAVFIYSGFGGVILRKEVLSIGKNFLHVHGGFLPAFKGSTTNYFSLLVEDSIGASAIFMNEAIDCGPVLLRRRFSPPLDRTQIDHVVDAAARAQVLVETLQNYVEGGEWNVELPDNLGGDTYYIIHPVLKHIAMLATGASDD
jgi:methionyl-tRNA formyltransferase